MSKRPDRGVTPWTPDSLEAALQAGTAEIVREAPAAKIVITVRVDGGLVDELTEIAAARGVRPTALMRQYIEAGVAADRQHEDLPSLVRRVEADVARLAAAVHNPPQAA